MRRKAGLLFACLLAVGVATPAAQKSRDAVEVDPDVHHIVFENEHVRVFEARATPGTTSPMHTHPPILVVSIGSARVKFTLPDGSTQIVDLRPGQVLWFDGAEHSWNLLAGNVHVVGVEVKSARPKAAK